MDNRDRFLPTGTQEPKQIEGSARSSNHFGGSCCFPGTIVLSQNPVSITGFRILSRILRSQGIVSGLVWSSHSRQVWQNRQRRRRRLHSQYQNQIFYSSTHSIPNAFGIYYRYQLPLSIAKWPLSLISFLPVLSLEMIF